MGKPVIPLPSAVSVVREMASELKCKWGAARTGVKPRAATRLLGLERSPVVSQLSEVERQDRGVVWPFCGAVPWAFALGSLTSAVHQLPKQKVHFVTPFPVSGKGAWHQWGSWSPSSVSLTPLHGWSTCPAFLSCHFWEPSRAELPHSVR